MPTAIGIKCDLLQINKLRKVDVQLVVDKIAKKTPSMAAHVKRYLGRLFAWGMQRGHMVDRENPGHSLDAPTERKAFKMPTRDVMAAVITFARDRGRLTAHSRGSCPPYLWIVIVLAYRLRLRGIEVLTMTDADASDKGLMARRRKGSLDNEVLWSPELRQVWTAAQAHRSAVWGRLNKMPPIKPSDRPIIVGQTGNMLVTFNEKGETVDHSSMDSAWKRFMDLAVREKIIDESQRFTLHGLKHRGITDSKDKKSGGHVTPGMTKRYDHEIPLVDQAGSGFAS